ncbi:MAG: hypothetical protein KGN01_07915 [Patescibacteria group bacterium]|nr:hypothetical protein [Patescibacteria group bacterium]
MRFMICSQSRSSLDAYKSVKNYDIEHNGADLVRVEGGAAMLDMGQHSPPSPFDDGRDWVYDHEPYEEVIIQRTDWPFKCLGYDHGKFYFLPQAANQIIYYQTPALNEANLRGLAPTDWWQSMFPKKKGVDWQAAADALIAKCHAAGVFHSDDRQRGCGVWAERGGPLVHCGDKLIYGGSEYSAFDFESHYIYEAAPPRFRIGTKALTTDESKILYDICTGACWKNDKSGKILAGWIVASIVGGCLKWRPHIWIMGERGSGKSWIISDVLSKIFGSMAYFLGAGSTEAGIRQSLQHDSLPVIMDEMEGESLRDSEILQSIITMSRRSSSGQRMAKGTAEGTAQSFTLQSSFCFASINHSIAHGADESRISILECQRDTRDPHIFAQLEELASRTLTPEYSERLLRRVIEDMPYILKNVKTFMAAIRSQMKDARSSQQLAPLLAGVFSLTRGGLISLEAAKKWIETNDFKPYTAVEAQKDCERAFDFLMTSRMKIVGKSKTYDVQIGKAISVALGDTDEEGFDNKEARAALEAYDIKVRPPKDKKGNNIIDRICIRLNSQHISRIYKATPWAISWSKALRLNEFVRDGDKTIRIGATSSRVIVIDTSCFDEEHEPSLADLPDISM